MISETESGNSCYDDCNICTDLCGAVRTSFFSRIVLLCLLFRLLFNSFLAEDLCDRFETSDHFAPIVWLGIAEVLLLVVTLESYDFVRLVGKRIKNNVLSKRDKVAEEVSVDLLTLDEFPAQRCWRLRVLQWIKIASLVALRLDVLPTRGVIWINWVPSVISQKWNILFRWDVQADPVRVNHVDQLVVFIVIFDLVWQDGCLGLKAVPSRILGVLDAEAELLRGDLWKARSDLQGEVTMERWIVEFVFTSSFFSSISIRRSIVVSKLDFSCIVLVQFSLDRIDCAGAFHTGFFTPS